MPRAQTLPRPSTRRRPQARALATRARVLQAAEELFTLRGVESSSMAEVAERAAVGVGTLYHHFPDKHSLLLALIDAWGNRELARDRSELDFERYLGADPRAAIHADLTRRYERLRRHGSLYLVLLELADRDPDVRVRLQRIRQVGIERLRELVEFGQRRGLMRASADPLAAAFLIRHAIDMAATEVLVHRVADPAPERVLEELTDMISRYILEDPR